MFCRLSRAGHGISCSGRLRRTDRRFNNYRILRRTDHGADRNSRPPRVDYDINNCKKLRRGRLRGQQQLPGRESSLELTVGLRGIAQGETAMDTYVEPS